MWQYHGIVLLAIEFQILVEMDEASIMRLWYSNANCQLFSFCAMKCVPLEKCWNRSGGQAQRTVLLFLTHNVICEACNTSICRSSQCSVLPALCCIL